MIIANGQIEKLYRQLGGEVSVYTLDERGTGQSTRLACNPSSSSAPAPADSSAQLRECLQSLSDQYNGHLVAFSITSAAYDLVTLISQTQTDSDVVIYGLGHGTLVVERLLHFGVNEIKGYVLDGSVATSGSSLNQFAYVSQADAEFGEVGDEFLRLCEGDLQCSTKFQGNRSVSEALNEVLERVDDSQCASLWRESGAISTGTWSTAYPTSLNVRHTLAMLMQNATERALIPVVVYRFSRCNAQDQDVLKNLVARLQERERELERHGELVYDLQAFSEQWELGSLLPNQNAMMTRFTEALISPGRVFEQVPKYCVFAGDTSSEACAVLEADNSSKSVVPTRFRYARDKFWNVAATIPAHASVLLFTSNLDGQAPLHHATLLAEVLQGSAKALLTFESGAHGVLTGAVQDPIGMSSSCGLEILSSYILNSGSLDACNKSCMEQLKPMSFEITAAMSLRLLNVTDAYDGTPRDSSLPSAPGSVAPVQDDANTSIRERETSSLERSRNRYRVAFIVVACLLALVLFVVLGLLYRRRDSKELQHEEDQLRQMRGEASDDLELLRQIYMSSPEAWGRDDALFGRGGRGAGSNVAMESIDMEENGHHYRHSSNSDDDKETKEPSNAWVYRSKHLQL